MKILFKGYYNIYHSYALTNYFQFKELIKKDVLVFHEKSGDLFKNCKTFETEYKFLEYQNEKVDLIYSHTFPYVVEESDVPQVLFFTSEYGEFIRDYWNVDLEAIRRLVLEKRLFLLTCSDSSAESFRKEGIDVNVIPHGVCLDTYYPETTLKLRDEKTFLNVSAFSGNKNLKVILKAFILYFKRNGSGYLFLKGNEMYRCLDSYRNLIQGLVDEEFITLAEFYEWIQFRVKIITESLTFEKMRKLYNSVDVYLDAGIYEGFCIPIIEARSCMLTVITDFRAPLRHLANACYSDYKGLSQLMEKSMETRELPGEFDVISVVNRVYNFFEGLL